jgi:hypothetical protein
MSLHPRTNSRRQFLKAAITGASASVIAPLVITAQDKASSQQPRVGKGAYTYECYHGWGNDSLPAGHRYGNASHGVAIASDGLIYITHQGGPGSIFVFDPTGRFVKAMGEVHNRNTSRGHGIDIRREGNEEFIYLAPSDSDMAFTKMTLAGEIVWQKDRQAINKNSGLLDDPNTAFRPTNTSFRPDGGYYLGDGYGSHYLYEYDRNDRFVRALGGPGAEPGQFQTPHGQWLDTRGSEPRLVVADRANERLQWFNLDGTHFRTQAGFLFPADIDIQGELMVVPDLHARITLLDRDNQVVAQLGDDELWREQVLADKMAMRRQPQLWRPGRFVHPHDACFDSAGNIYVTEWVSTGRVTKLVHV